jgi:cytochrome c peroxidase
MKLRNSRIIFILFTLFIWACKKDPEVKLEPPVYDIHFNVPADWPAALYNFENNPLSEDGFRLGRKLFYEVRLSRDNSVSCGSCHQQFAAFAHKNHPLSHGIDSRFGTRNSPAMFNLNWHPEFMWDGGINHLEVQPASPITNPVEMDETLFNVVEKLENDPQYKRLFKKAFGDEKVNTQRMFKAMAQFMGMLVSAESKYDKVKKGEIQFSELEKRGYEIFKHNCSSCHTEPLFTDFSYRNNGLPPNPEVDDLGRALITNNAADNYKFKIPSLRNLTYSGFFMHDGRFRTLYQVLDHYQNGIEASATLDPLLANSIELSPEERSALIAFLNTLNDEHFINDPRFAEP